MGECGCADGFGDIRVAGPEGQVYTIRLASSCDYCDTPLALLIDWHSAVGKKSFEEELSSVPEFVVEPMQFSKDFGGSALPTMDPRELTKELFKRGLLAGADADSEAGDWLDEVCEAMNAAACNTWSKWLRERISKT